MLKLQIVNFSERMPNACHLYGGVGCLYVYVYLCLCPEETLGSPAVVLMYNLSHMPEQKLYRLILMFQQRLPFIFLRVRVSRFLPSSLISVPSALRLIVRGYPSMNRQ